MFRALASLFTRAGRLQEERRRLIRVPCDIPVLIRSGTSAWAAVVRNLGPGGMKAELAEPLQVGSRVTVEREGEGEPLRCSVKWCKRGHAGLVVEDCGEDFERTWAAARLAQLGVAGPSCEERRREIRARGPLALAVLGPSGERLAQGRLADLGRGGALIELPAGCSLEGPICIELGPHGELAAVVIQARVLSSLDLGGHISHRLEFAGNSGQVLRAIERYVAVLLSEQKP